MSPLSGCLLAARPIPLLPKSRTARATKSSSGTRRVYLFLASTRNRFAWFDPKSLVTQNHYRQRQLQPETTAHEWLWITTLDPQAFPANQVRRLGHDRWKLENNGWNDLTQNWAFQHGFLHACRHRPQTCSPHGTRQPVPNRGLPAVTLILLLAFTLSSAFTLRLSELFRRYRMTTIEVAHQLRRSLSKPPPTIRAPES
jgi:hypothetical protein